MKRPTLWTIALTCVTVLVCGCSRGTPSAQPTGMHRVASVGGNARWEVPVSQNGQHQVSQYEAYVQLSKVAQNAIPELASAPVKQQFGGDGETVSLTPNDVHTSKVTRQQDGSWLVEGSVTVKQTGARSWTFPWKAQAVPNNGEWNLSNVQVGSAS